MPLASGTGQSVLFPLLTHRAQERSWTQKNMCIFPTTLHNCIDSPVFSLQVMQIMWVCLSCSRFCLADFPDMLFCFFMEHKRKQEMKI